MAVCAAVCGSARGSVRQCMAVRAAAQCLAVRVAVCGIAGGSVRAVHAGVMCVISANVKK
jgi:hypothetical protein